MASLIQCPGGRWRIEFTGADRKRKTLRIGKRTRRAAELIRAHVEHLVGSAIWGRALPPDTSAWAQQSVDRILRPRLERLGLIEQRSEARQARVVLGELVDVVMRSRSDVCERTHTNWRLVKANLVAYFGARCDIASITAGAAQDFKAWLHTAAKRIGVKTDQPAGLSRNTVGRRLNICIQIFDSAIGRELVQKNPFRGLGMAVKANPARRFYVTPEIAARVLEACPTLQWKLLFALARYAGLRTPSESLALRWSGIDFARSRMIVPCIKTSRLEGRAERVVPIAPELMPLLTAAHAEAAAGDDRVLTLRNSSTANLRTGMHKIIRRAGFPVWPKIFQNCRASRATEWAAEHPQHVAAAWAGHSVEIAESHYWGARDSDFDRAAELRATDCAPRKATGQTPKSEENGRNAAQAASVAKSRDDADLHENRGNSSAYQIEGNALCSKKSLARPERLFRFRFARPNRTPKVWPA